MTCHKAGYEIYGPRLGERLSAGRWKTRVRIYIRPFGELVWSLNNSDRVLALMESARLRRIR
jgi:hypothetical protein